MATGLNLRELREAQGLGLNEFARTVGIDPGHLSRIERGGHDPSLGMLRRLAEALNVDVSALLDSNTDQGDSDG